jgi:hypothetical protein
MARRFPQHTPGQPVRQRAPAPRSRQPFAALFQALGVAGGLWAAACQRQAPGPDECVAFAEAWMRRHRAPTRLDADAAFDELVRTCLTDPYDRELVACVVGGDDQERCRIAYMRRVEERREARER